MVGSLGQHCPYPGVGGIYIHHKLPLGVQERQDESRGETGLEVLESSLGLR